MVFNNRSNRRRRRRRRSRKEKQQSIIGAFPTEFSSDNKNDDDKVFNKSKNIFHCPRPRRYKRNNNMNDTRLLSPSSEDDDDDDHNSSSNNTSSLSLSSFVVSTTRGKKKTENNERKVCHRLGNRWRFQNLLFLKSLSGNNSSNKSCYSELPPDKENHCFNDIDDDSSIESIEYHIEHHGSEVF